jgi:hypothetical protein
MRPWIVATVGCLALAGCTLGAPGTATPAVSGEDVIRTAEAAAAMTRQAATSTSTPTPITPSSTPVPPTATRLPLSTENTPVITATQTAYIRAGPDVAYSWAGLLYSGETAFATGRHETSAGEIWWLIHRTSDGLEGWVWGGAVTVSGDASTVPQLEAPPTPTPGSSPTPSPPLP